MRAKRQLVQRPWAAFLLGQRNSGDVVRNVVQDQNQTSKKALSIIYKLLIFLGERAGNRTRDLLIKSQMLYRLSYALPQRDGLQ